jgi:DNA-nicking Smr family endonuclease
MSKRKRRGPAHPVFEASDPLLDTTPIATIDLHGLSAAEARHVLTEQLKLYARLYERGVIEVITGKGLRSSGPAVLRPFVRGLLKGPLSSYVADMSDAVHGGGYRIRLR